MEVGVGRDFNPKPVLILVLSLMLTANIMTHILQKPSAFILQHPSAVLMLLLLLTQDFDILCSPGFLPLMFFCSTHVFWPFFLSFLDDLCYSLSSSTGLPWWLRW